MCLGDIRWPTYVRWKQHVLAVFYYPHTIRDKEGKQTSRFESFVERWAHVTYTEWWLKYFISSQWPEPIPKLGFLMRFEYSLYWNVPDYFLNKLNSNANKRNIFDNYEISRCNIGVGDFSLLRYILYHYTLHYPEYGKSKISRNVLIHIPVCMVPNLRALVLLCHDDIVGFSKLRTTLQAM